jgi:hypothetical protein
MGKMRRQFCAVITAVVFSVANVRGGIELVKNGGFENGFDHWELTAEFPIIVLGTDAHRGSYASFQGGVDSLACISQKLETVADQSYILEFWVKNIIYPAEFQMMWDGKPLFTLDYGQKQDYMRYSFTVTGKGGDTLTFGAQNNPDWVRLDDVSVIAVPEPTTMITGGFLLLPFGMHALRQVRKNGKA